ncbi:MAG: hypothetical protein K9G38_05040 [Bacteroidales bacterium]|nr:hypothetical protein [Bacteroidales bacterium]
MKNIFILGMAYFLFVGIVNAQESDIIGKWTLTTMQKGNEIREANSGIIFEENNILKLGFFNMEEIIEAGTWEYDKKQKSIVMISTVEKTMNGKAELIKVTEDELQYKKDDVIYSLVKYVEDEVSGAMLDFSETDFFTEDGGYKYEGEEEKLPWKDPSEMLMSLVNVKHLVYNYSKLNEGTESFEDNTLSADVAANAEEMSLIIDYIFYGFDRYDLPEDRELPPNTEYMHPMYPEVEFNFRIVDAEEITTNAGTFLCTVIEAAQEEIQKKLWMINDKPGIYAKIIIEKPGMYGAYSLEIFELNEIQ